MQEYLYHRGARLWWCLAIGDIRDMCEHARLWFLWSQDPYYFTVISFLAQFMYSFSMYEYGRGSNGLKQTVNWVCDTWGMDNTYARWSLGKQLSVY